MTGVQHLTLGTPDPVAAEAFYDAAFGLGDILATDASQEPSTGFRGFVLSLVVGQPSTVDSLVATALDAGATTLKPVTKSFWGYGGVLQAPDGAIWKVATSSKKDTGPLTRDIDRVVLLLGATDVKASRRFYVDHGLTVAKSFGSKYVEFDASGSAVTLALYGRRAAAKDAGVAPDGTGSHRIVIGGALGGRDGGADGSGTDPDGFIWRPAPATSRHSPSAPHRPASRG